MSMEGRFWPKVAKSEGCWEWTGYVDRRTGYGRFRRTGAAEHMRGAHRVAYELLVGPIPEGLVIDHLCRNRSCVNPTHMEPVTRGENTRRGLAGVKFPPDRLSPVCPNGHEYRPETTGLKNGRRQCRICALATSRRHQSKKRVG